MRDVEGLLALSGLVIAACLMFGAASGDHAQVARDPKAAADGPDRGVRVPILMYHHVADPGNAHESVRLWFVTPERFTEQMEWLHRAAFTTITPEQLRARLIEGTPLPPRPILITFDDGWAEQYAAAFPVLKRLGMTATFYVYSNGMAAGNAGGYLSWDQLKEMHAAGMTIGGHTISHPNLTALPDDAVTRELVESKAAIEKNLGVPCTTFAYPYGDFDGRVTGLVRQSGYTSAMGTEPGHTQRPDDLFELRRVRVSSHETLETFKALLPSAEEQERRR